MRLYKPELLENGEQKKLAGQWTLYQVFYAVIRLAAPYIPHVTEEIYQEYFRAFVGVTSLHITDYPQVEEFAKTDLGGDALKASFGKALDILEQVRRYKTEQQISLGADIKKLTIS